jgi:hypothetical protein
MSDTTPISPTHWTVEGEPWQFPSGKAGCRCFAHSLAISVGVGSKRDDPVKRIVVSSSWTTRMCTPVLDIAVFLGASSVLLPVTASRSLPVIASYAIGYAEPRPGTRSPGFRRLSRMMEGTRT